MRINNWTIFATVSRFLMGLAFFMAFFIPELKGNELKEKQKVERVSNLPTLTLKDEFINDFSDDWKFKKAHAGPIQLYHDNPGSGSTSADPARNFALYGFADHGGIITSEVIKMDYDDNNWLRLDVPHDFLIESDRLFNYAGGNGYYSDGLGWYRKKFIVPGSWQLNEKRITINFESVFQRSDVYVNGSLVGYYPDGYSGFSFEITDFLNNGENVVVVKAQNKAHTRWYQGCGITGKVTISVADHFRFTRNSVIYETPHLETSYKANATATLNISATIDAKQANNLAWLETTVYDASGAVVANGTSGTVEPSSATTTTMTQSLNIPNVRLWSIDDPYRYTIRTKAMFQDMTGTITLVADEKESKYGFRWHKMEPAGGFFLNGKHIKIRGVNMHHDQGALGNAANEDAWRRQIRLLKEQGVNFWRTSHNPVSPRLIDLCSEMGMLMMHESYDSWSQTLDTGIPGGLTHSFLRLVPKDWAGLALGMNLPSGGNLATRVMPKNWTWSDWVVMEMVTSSMNEACVVMWSTGNEVNSTGTNKPDWYNYKDYLKAGDPDPELSTEVPAAVKSGYNIFTEAMRLRNVVHMFDKSRVIFNTTDQIRTPVQVETMWGYVIRVSGGLGIQYNSHHSFPILRARFPNTVFMATESGAGFSFRGEYHDPLLPSSTPNYTPGKRGTSSYDNTFDNWNQSHAYALKWDRDFVDNPGMVIWSGWDYLGEPRPYSIFPVGKSSMAPVETTGFPKDNYFLYRSQWTKADDAPMAHITPMNWTDWRPYEPVEVWVYTNARKAELFLNNVSLGEKSFDEKTTTWGYTYQETTETTNLDDSSTMTGGVGDVQTLNGIDYPTGPNVSSTNTGGYVSPNGSFGNMHLSWTVPFEPGELKVVAKKADGTPIAEDAVKTAGKPFAVSMKPDKTVLKADGSSLSYIACHIVDEFGVMVPRAKNRICFDLEGAGYIVGIDNGNQDSDDLHKWGNMHRNKYSEADAFNGKILLIVQSAKGESGSIAITAKGKNYGLAESAITLLATQDGAGTNNAVCEIKPLGAAVSVETVTHHTTAGQAMKLPLDVKVNYANGAQIIRKAVWDAIPATAFNTIGKVTVNGKVAGTALTATANLNIGATPDTAEDIAYNPNLDDYTYVNDDGLEVIRPTSGPNALTRQIQTGPVASASMTTSVAGTPNRILKDVTTNYWTNRYSRSQNRNVRATWDSRPYEFVEVIWPDPVSFNEVNLYFILEDGNETNTSTDIPKSLNVQYWDGFEWIDAANQVTVFATGSDKKSSVTFDRVLTKKVRVGMENASPYSREAGALMIKRFQVFDKK